MFEIPIHCILNLWHWARVWTIFNLKKPISNKHVLSNAYIKQVKRDLVGTPVQPLAEKRVSGKCWPYNPDYSVMQEVFWFYFLETFSVALLCLCIASSLRNAVSRTVHTVLCISCPMVQYPKVLCTGGPWNARASLGNQRVATLEKEGNKLKTWEELPSEKREKRDGRKCIWWSSCPCVFLGKRSNFGVIGNQAFLVIGIKYCERVDKSKQLKLESCWDMFRKKTW